MHKSARAVVCPSIAEGFDLSGIEAMLSGGVVAASDIPVHRESENGPNPRLMDFSNVLIYNS
ncbi:hypothetical protein LC062_21040 [Stappia indica]|nr:hypothetical protein [Stappia indica]MCA1300820.1 hypothetical protein [Stappia indica]